MKGYDTAAYSNRRTGTVGTYAKLCIDNVHARFCGYRRPRLTTISLVQGTALGGGFECALSSDVIVAEESARLGLPEILFNLFPRPLGWLCRLGFRHRYALEAL
jgi:DSF synthase